ncbi:TSUP family transporter [Sphingopyxis panaciterrae]
MAILLYFVIGAIPAAFIAGGIEIPGDYYRPLVGVVLWIAAARLLWPRKIASLEEPKAPHPVVLVLAGVSIGALSGLTGTGGGIFLSPLILFLGGKRCARRPAYRRVLSCAYLLRTSPETSPVSGSCRPISLISWVR